LIRLDEASAEQFANIPEAGMGYHVVEGSLRSEDKRQLFIVTEGDLFAIPADHPDYFSYTDYVQPELSLGTQTRWLESLEGNIRPHQLDINIPSALSNFSVMPGYAPTTSSNITSMGAQPLLGMIHLKNATNFYRYIWKPNDARFDKNKNELLQGTYLTTENDRNYANTGFAAVGRYALPNPTPACYVFEYRLPAGTNLLVGTVCPNFGQAGGGVEVRLVSNTSVNPPPPLPISEY